MMGMLWLVIRDQVLASCYYTITQTSSSSEWAELVTPHRKEKIRGNSVFQASEIETAHTTSGHIRLLRG